MATSNLPPRHQRKKRRIWPWVLLVLCFVAAAAAGALFASTSLLDKPVEKAVDDGLLRAHDKSTIMIMGVDEREDDVGRSDTHMIATQEPKKEQAAVRAIPRETRVKSKGHGFDKINAAYAYGGERLTQDTVEGFLGVDMDHYIIINTHAFTKIIDALGGIDIDVEKRMYYTDPWDDDGGLVIDLRPGMQHMDGKTAVTYVRFRDEEGDIGRIKRQQKFVKACMDKITSPAVIPNLPGVIRAVLDSVKTDLSFRQLLEFAGTLKEAQKNGLKADMVPGKPLYIDGVSYWIPDVKDLRTTLANTLGITLNATARRNLEEAVQEYEKSIPSTAREVPASDTSIGRSEHHSQSGLKDKEQRKQRDEGRSSKDSSTSNGRSSEGRYSESRDDSSRREQPAEPTPATPSETPAAPTPGVGTSKTSN